MKFVRFVILLTLLISTATSIKCVAEWRIIHSMDSGKDQKTCEGEYCINFLHDDHLQETDKNCGTGLEKTMGGWNDKTRNGTVCICNSEMCNSKDVKQYVKEQTGPPTVVPWYKCHKHDLNDGARFEHDCQRHILHSGSIVFSAPPHEFGRLLESTWRTQQINDDESPDDFCSDEFRKSWLTRREDVLCHNAVSQDSNATTCSGEFCVFYDDPSSKAVRQRQACLTTNQTNAEGNYTIGIYKSRTQSVYVCKGNYCNRDKDTAQKWIEDYGNGLVQAGSPIYGRPLNVENVAAGHMLFLYLPIVFSFVTFASGVF